MLLLRGAAAAASSSSSSSLAQWRPCITEALRCLSTTAATQQQEEQQAREQMKFDLLIVGAGPAGLSAAIRFKQVRGLDITEPRPSTLKTLKPFQHVCAAMCGIHQTLPANTSTWVEAEQHNGRPRSSA